MMQNIFRKEPCDYVIDDIYICNDIKHIHITTNEIARIYSGADMEYAAKGLRPWPYVNTGDPEQRIQRRGIYLSDVRYVIQGHLQIYPERFRRNPETGKMIDYPSKFPEMLYKSLRRGAYRKRRPYFGLSDCLASFAAADTGSIRIPESLRQKTVPLGDMFYDWLYDPAIQDPVEQQKKAVPLYFDPVIENGRIRCTPGEVEFINVRNP